MLVAGHPHVGRDPDDLHREEGPHPAKKAPDTVGQVEVGLGDPAPVQTADSVLAVGVDVEVCVCHGGGEDALLSQLQDHRPELTHVVVLGFCPVADASEARLGAVITEGEILEGCAEGNAVDRGAEVRRGVERAEMKAPLPEND
jgi:hypothetical protein